MAGWLSIIIPLVIALAGIIVGKFYRDIMPSYIFITIIVLIVASGVVGLMVHSNEQKQIESQWHMGELQPRTVLNV